MTPAEGEEWLVALVVALLLLGALRHRLEPWLAGVAGAPPQAAFDSLAALGGERFGLIDPNRASAAELETLPRIGPALAARIVAERERGGPFRRREDLRRVKGIGPATLAGIAPHVHIEADPEAPGGSRPGEEPDRGIAPWTVQNARPPHPVNPDGR